MIRFRQVKLSFAERLDENVKMKKGKKTLKFYEFSEELKRAVEGKFKKNCLAHFDEKLQVYDFFQKTKLIRVSKELDWLIVQEYKKIGNLTSKKCSKEYLLEIIE
ncbi:hypothetical protein ACV3UL_07805 [Clostridium perfringens]